MIVNLHEIASASQVPKETARETESNDDETSSIPTEDDYEETLADSTDDATIAEKPHPTDPPPTTQHHLYDDKNTEFLRAKIIAVTEERSQNRPTSLFARAAKAASLALATTQTSPHDRSVLCFAAGALDAARAASLIDRGVPLNADASFGHGPLSAAVRSKPPRPAAQAAMLEFLVAEGADVNYLGADGVTPLCAAVDAGCATLVRTLLDLGADADDCRSSLPSWKWFVGEGMTALHVAVSKGREECFRVLVDRGADPGVRFRVSGDCNLNYPIIRREVADDAAWLDGVTALHVAVNDVGCVKGLLGLGADLLARDGRGRTPFHWAIDVGNLKVVMLFLGRGYPVDDPGEEGVTALGMICAALERGFKSKSFPALTEELLRAGASLDVVYPQDLSIKQRWLLMDDWRDTYGPLFKRLSEG